MPKLVYKSIFTLAFLGLLLMPGAEVWGQSGYEFGTDLLPTNTNSLNQLENIDEQIDELTQQILSDPDNQELRERMDELMELRGTARGEVQSQIDNAPAQCWSPLGGLVVGACIEIGFAWMVSNLMWVFGSLLWVASRIFDLSVFVSIASLGEWFNGEAVKTAWRLLRDLANLSFVFILLYIALATVFDFQAVRSGTNKLVVKVIIVALLVNFSGFFVRVVVDASNVIAYEFYTRLGGTTELVTGQTIGLTLMQKLSMDRYLINDDNPDSPQIETLSVGRVALQGLGNIFMILITAFVLLVAAVLFIIRTVTLLFLYIFSPIALASYALKDISSQFYFFDRWKDSLIKQSFFAPAFLIPLFIVFTLIGDNGIANLTATSGNLLGFGGLLLVMSNILILGMIIGSIFIAQKIGAVGLSAATAAGSAGLGAGLKPFSRYGGRATRAIAGSKAAKAVAGAIPGGQRLRQSWNTGVLSDIKRSDFGKQTGQVMSRPFSSSVGALSRGVGAATGIRGVDLNNITGKETFTKQVEDKAGKIYEEMKKIESPADKAKFLEGLAGFTQKEEFKAVYTKLGPDERVKLEQEATKLNPNGNLAKSLTAQRLSLKGDAAQKTAVEMVKESKGADKLKAVEKLSESDFNAVYKSMDPNDRASVKEGAIGRKEMGDKIKVAEKKMIAKKAGEVRLTQRIFEASQALGDLTPGQYRPLPKPHKDLNNDPSTIKRIKHIQALSGSELMELTKEKDIFDGNHRDLYPYLTVNQLRKIVDVVNSEELVKIKESILSIPNEVRDLKDNEVFKQTHKYLTDPNSSGRFFT